MYHVYPICQMKRLFNFTKNIYSFTKFLCLQINSWWRQYNHLKHVLLLKKAKRC